MKKVVKTTIIFIICAINFLIPACKSEETRLDFLYVGGSGEGNYTSIQAAINNATDGDTINVMPGTYFENIIVNKSLTLRGNSFEDTIIVSIFEVVRIKANWTNMSGFTLINQEPNPSDIHGNIGIELVDSDNCRIEKNNISSIAYGIYIYNSNFNTIAHNIVSSGGKCIDLYYSNNNTIYNNYFDSTENSWDNGNNLWNINKSIGTNIIGGAHLGGNFWINYNGTDKNNDGIGDTPYEIPGGDNVDRYPLMAPFEGENKSKEFIIDYELVYRILVVGIIISIIFVLPIAYYWRKKYYL